MCTCNFYFYFFYFGLRRRDESVLGRIPEPEYYDVYCTIWFCFPILFWGFTIYNILVKVYIYNVLWCNELMDTKLSMQVYRTVFLLRRSEVIFITALVDVFFKLIVVGYCCFEHKILLCSNNLPFLLYRIIWWLEIWHNIDFKLKKNWWHQLEQEYKIFIYNLFETRNTVHLVLYCISLNTSSVDLNDWTFIVTFNAKNQFMSSFYLIN